MRWDQPFSSSFHLRISLLLFQRGRRRNEFTEEGEVKGRLGGGGGGGGRGGKCTEGGGGAISLKGKEGRKERGIFLVSHCGGGGGGDDNADARQREGEKVFLAPFPSSLWSLFFASAEREIAFFVPSDRGGGFCDCCVPKLGKAPFSSWPFLARFGHGIVGKRGRARERVPPNSTIPASEGLRALFRSWDIFPRLERKRGSVEETAWWGDRVAKTSVATAEVEGGRGGKQRAEEEGKSV